MNHVVEILPPFFVLAVCMMKIGDFRMRGPSGHGPAGNLTQIFLCLGCFLSN